MELLTKLTCVIGVMAIPAVLVLVYLHREGGR